MATVSGSQRQLTHTSNTYESNGDLTVGGNLNINGTTTTVDTANLLVEDHNIVIGNVSSPTDTTADGGGITLKGATDKTINWINSTDAWTFSDKISVPSLYITSNPSFSSEATALVINGSNQVGYRELGSNAFNSTAFLTGNQTITLSGDASGSGTTSINVTVANDSHTHDGRYFTETESDARFLGISAKAADSNLLDGYDSSAFSRIAANETISGNRNFTGTIAVNGTAFTSTNISNWNTAYGWGDHASAGYLTSLGTAILDGDFTSNGLMKRTGAGTYDIVTDNSSNWNTAYGWGNHASAGYLTGNQTITLSGDVSGSGTTSINVTVANDSHTHDGRYYTESESDARFWRTTQSLNLLSVTDGSSTNPFDNAHSETKIAASGTYVLSYSGASAHMISSYAGGSASVFQLGAHYNGDDFYMRVRTDSSNWKNWRKLFHDNYHPNADKLTTARSISLTGAVTGSTSFDGSGNVSIATTATADPTLTLAGDASGSATFTNLGNATLTVTVADDSHNHIISNIDGLQTALDGKATAGDENIIDGATSIWNADGDGDVFAYDDSNPTHNGKYVGAIIDVRGDGSSFSSLLKAGIFTSDHVSTANGYYVGTLLGYTNSTTTQVINSSGAWVGSAIGDSKISSASNWNTAYGWGDHASEGYLTGNQTITLSGDVSGSGTTSISVSLANDSVGAAEIAANAVGASELNVSGNGTTAQFLRSDGDGTFSWATPTDTNTTYSAGNGISLSGTTFSVAAGGGLTQDASGLSHSDTSSQASVNNSGGTVIQDITLDTYGHITAISSNDLDGRYYTETEVNTLLTRGYANGQAQSATGLTNGAWYTIASNSGNRAIARFGLKDSSSGDHQSVVFYAAHHFGTNQSSTITVLHNSFYSGSPFRYIRIKDGGTYDGAVLQVWVDTSHGASDTIEVYLLGDNFQGSGWELVDWLADATAPSGVSNYSSFAETSRIDLDQIAQGGIATTGPIYGDGDTTQYRMFNDNYHPNADKLTTARNIALTGAVTGNTNFDGSGNISIATTATADPTLTINGDASGSATFTNLGNATLTLTIADDSHNHTIANVDGLQTALDAKQAAGTYNTIIGTDSDINTSGSTIIDNIYVTDGVITSMGTRTLSASDISALTQSDYEAIHWKQTGRIFTPQCTPLFYNSSGTAGTLAAICFSRTETTTTANAWAQANLYRGITNEVSWSGGGIEFARKLGVSFRCAFLASGTQAQSIRYMVGGRANSVQAAGSNPIVSRGFGVEIRSRTGTTLEWRVFAHDGTSFSASSWTDIPSNATSVYTKELYIYSDGSGNIEAGIDDRGGDGSTWTTKTTTGGPTANGNSTYPYITHEVVNAASGSSYARARVYDYKIFSE